jgi:trimeric autotransporter adhesin
MLRILSISLLLLCGASSFAATFVVTSAADTAGSTCGSSCTLRQAITAANATTAADTINFGFTSPVRGEILISPASALPTITQPLTINGYSQSLTRVNDDLELTNAQLRIRLDGPNAGSTSSGLDICSNSVTIRGLMITRFQQAGIRIGADATGTLCTASSVQIHGNFIGMNNAGEVLVNAASLIVRGNSVVGSVALQDRNVLISTSGLVISSGQSTFAGNLINLTRSGMVHGAAASATLTTGVSSQAIGILAAPNRIGCTQKALVINSGNLGNNNLLGANRFIASGSNCQPIDLGNDGLTPNDLDDADSGPNGLQNFPVITAASRGTGTLSVTATLDVPVAGSNNYDIALYASSACSSNGHGPGERFLGFTTRTISNSTQNFTYNQATTDPLPPGTVITATATRAGVGTSEMSACFALDPLPLVVNTTDDVADGVCNSAHCSLRDAMIASNNATGTALQRIHFAVPPLTGTSEILIQPTAQLPDITKTVTIDGYSQPGTAVNIDPEVSNAILRVRISNPNTINVGLRVCANDSILRGLSVTRFSTSIQGCPGVRFAVEGSFLGLASDGSATTGNARGVDINGAPVRVGGSSPAQRNVIAGFTAVGIRVLNPNSVGTVISGNLFGSDKSFVNAVPNVNGSVDLGAFANGVIVGTQDAPNRFKPGNRPDIVLPTAASANSLAFNRFAAGARPAGALPIDLRDDGVTPNDPGDNDTGPNELLNFPELTLAERNANGLRLSGTVSRAPSTIVAYASTACQSNGHGPGEILLGAVNATGTSFDLQLDTDADLTAFPVITTTATFNGSTSEMSACITATDPLPGIAVDSSSDGAPDGGCNAVGDSNLCTLREAITLANSQAGADQIRFAIPGDGPHAISLGSQLPFISGGLLIDGYTQSGALPNAADQGSDAVLKIELRGGTSILNVLRTCTSETVELRGLAINGSTFAAIATQSNDNASCSAVGSLIVRGVWFGLNASGSPLFTQNAITSNNTVLTLGGPALADRNVIANTAAGVRIAGQASSGSVVQNNLFGLSPELTSGTNFDNSIQDLILLNVSSVRVGGDGMLGNSFNQSPQAILVSGADSDFNTLYANTFTRHTGPTAIDLSDTAGANGLNPNDINDVDSGANEGQNTPVLSDGSATASSITLNGTLDVVSGLTVATNYRLAFYRSSNCASAGFGRVGEVYLGSVLQGFTSNSENFSITLNVPPEAGFITATATSPAGSTSEFSNCLAAPLVDPIFRDGFE